MKERKQGDASAEIRLGESSEPADFKEYSSAQPDEVLKEEDIILHVPAALTGHQKYTGSLPKRKSQDSSLFHKHDGDSTSKGSFHIF